MEIVKLIDFQNFAKIETKILVTVNFIKKNLTLRFAHKSKMT